MIKKEVWFPIAGYNNIYEVSNYGDVKSLNRTIELKNGNKRKLQGRTLKPSKNQGGYFYVSLSKNGTTHTKSLQRLVAEAFIPNPNNFPQVNHLQGKENNTPDTLEWVTASENTQHSYRTGLNTNQGGNHSFAVGVIDNEIGQVFDTVKSWAAARGLNYSTARNIICGCNQSKTIDLSQIIKLQKPINKQNDQK